MNHYIPLLKETNSLTCTELRSAVHRSQSIVKKCKPKHKKLKTCFTLTVAASEIHENRSFSCDTIPSFPCLKWMVRISKTCGSNRAMPLATHNVKQWHYCMRHSLAGRVIEGILTYRRYTQREFKLKFSAL